jgi:hypothetical protein
MKRLPSVESTAMTLRQQQADSETIYLTPKSAQSPAPLLTRSEETMTWCDRLGWAIVVCTAIGTVFLIVGGVWLAMIASSRPRPTEVNCTFVQKCEPSVGSHVNP